MKALQSAGLPKIVDVSTEIVGPVVGAELRRKGIYATILSMLGITLWIAIRFRVSFALGSIVATIHDVLITLTLLVLFRYEMSLNVIAAMLTMVGYSMNDMIVIFDRVRENARSRKREPLDAMINTSLNQTLTRTVITSSTVFLAVLALYLFGGEVLKGFAFTMLAGTLATTYSGWFIAPSLAIMLSSGPTVASRAAAAPQAGAAAQQPTRKSKPQRKARAS
jgi:preprotein translocase subunit SecF